MRFPARLKAIPVLLSILLITQEQLREMQPTSILMRRSTWKGKSPITLIPIAPYLMTDIRVDARQKLTPRPVLHRLSIPLYRPQIRYSHLYEITRMHRLAKLRWTEIYGA